MKRLIALAALLLAASACATTTDNANTTANTNTNTNANAAPSATPTPSGASQADIEAKERQAWDAVKSKNVDAFGALLADDFINVNDTGVYDKAGTVKGIQGEVATDITLSNFKLLKVDEDAAAITYDVAWTGTHEGKSQTVNLRASSAWAKRGQRWYAILHQGTPVSKMKK
jgi:ketosteroid isomerase-like protein